MEDLHPLSTIERLPTELLQHIASYLLRRYPTFEEDLMLPEFTSCPGFFGLMEFRETSRTIRSKTEFTFNACFETHALSFTDGSILSLLEMSNHEGIRSRMSSVTFVAPYPNWNRYSYYGHPRYEHRLKLAAELPEVRDLLRCHSINTSIIAAALRRLRVTSVILGPSLVTTHWDDCQQSELDTVMNPATIIFNATILSKIRLECLYMDMSDWGTFQGMQPDPTCYYLIKARPLSYLENMTTLALALHNPMTLADEMGTTSMLGTLSAMLSKCYNLEHLDLGLDKRTVQQDWPRMGNAFRVWLAIADLEYSKLSELRLSGFVMDSDTLQGFLSRHKRSMLHLEIDNCYLDGSWTAALAPLRTSPGLRTLILDQISEQLLRVEWSVPFSHDLSNMNELLRDGEDDDDWVYVICVGFCGMRFEFPEQDVDERMSEIFGSMRLTHRPADPGAEDALNWHAHRLPF
ncbi:hypothetical protein HBI56_095070 [Parastagonospora nodorum]|uniref:Uncharacterized protein n=1 Tax=Phaeosphaeria nodorum (strain SN15 / ATCC MYA-4574 / FGSC 10173) TaxID=321614 RepID=A0A7U2I1D6_PHANO|nr:hypothetical protein HBH56_090360 [Parastagonospora nodorum]QRC98219.1 hypothetical protein JI435_043040 [Parastagonospora nodorum SN15]KAH3936713.1 hypothetical protein HBH54_025000 [Parastagonospora nodorum]KAH3945596.1 hypothetical protein HBH53_142100 [Parastagonospora nodorum]KAH3966372.1 hypothetical protein HBH51_143260 [Parastagonospora nodorum]